MDALIPIHKDWASLIFSGIKLSDFRNQYPAKLSSGSIVYLYETAENGGCQKVVGQFTVDKIININKPSIEDELKFKALITQPFILDYLEKIENDTDIAEKFRNTIRLSQEKNIPYEDVASFATSSIAMEYILNTGEAPDSMTIAAEQTENTDLFNYFSKVKSITEEIEKEKVPAVLAIKNCFKWLLEIGLCYKDDYSKFAIGIKNACKYEKPISLDNFAVTKTKKRINFAPQTLIYIEKLKKSGE